MPKSTHGSNRLSGYPVVILVVTTIILLEAGRTEAVDIDSQEETHPSTKEAENCPDYCNLAPDRATRGKAPFRKWFFDASEGECKPFRWGGRGGNKNRFRKKTDCEETCSSCSLDAENPVQTKQTAETLNDAVCSQSLDEGRCRNDGPEPRSESEVNNPQLAWHFNTAKAKCTPFIFYGCGGNQNRFSSMVECEEICH